MTFRRSPPSSGAYPSFSPSDSAVLEVRGITCSACAGVIESALSRVPGVTEVRVCAAAERAHVRWQAEQTGLQDILAAMRGAGYEGLPSMGLAAVAARAAEARTLLWRLFVASFCAMQVMMLATPSYVAGPGDLAPDLRALLNWGQWLLSLPVMAFSAGPFFAQARRAIALRRISMDVPVALGIAIMFVAGSAVTFSPSGVWGDDVWFDSLTMFVALLLAGRWFEMRMRHRAATELETLLQVPVRPAWKLTDEGRLVETPVHALAVGDRVRVAVGEPIPADGVVLVGRTEVSESLMTGESLPVLREPGHRVHAGSLNLGAPVDVCVTAVGAHTRRQRLVDMAEQAMLERPRLLRAADEWAGPFLWTVLALATAGGLLWMWIDPSRAWAVAVSVLVVTCPCALSLSAPAALMAGARGMVRHGIWVQRLAALEGMWCSSAVVFDKTGTLTQDKLKLSGCSDPALLPAVASLSTHSRHPVSVALAQAHIADEANPWRDVSEFPGRGLQGTDVQGRVWRLGRRDWVVSSDSVPVPDGDAEGMRVHAAVDGHLVGWFLLTDAVRTDAQRCVATLRAMGLTCWVLSGDADRRVRAVAQQLSLSVLGADALPQGKMAAVARLQAEGQVVIMVGDGVNDAPVLARADVSIALGHGSGEALAKADLLIMGSELAAVSTAICMARRIRRILVQNLIWAAAYNVASIPLALMGWLPPWLAGVGMALSSLLVVINSQRAGRVEPPAWTSSIS